MEVQETVLAVRFRLAVDTDAYNYLCGGLGVRSRNLVVGLGSHEFFLLKL